MRYLRRKQEWSFKIGQGEGLRIAPRSSSRTMQIEVLRNSGMSRLFLAAAEAAEEAILNSLFKARAMEGRDGHRAKAFPLDKLKKIMKEGQKQ